MYGYIIKNPAGEIIHSFSVKSDLSAKRYTSRFCGNSSDLYKSLKYFSLYTADGRYVGAYCPFFCFWSKL